MGDYSKFNLVYRLQKWMDSVPGQTFLNYAYSWGASVVILGTLFKLTHLPGANFMLFLGMGTEVLVFFLSAFDRPFDKTADGRDLPTHVTEEYLETGKVVYGNAPSDGQNVVVGGGVVAAGSETVSAVSSGEAVSTGANVVSAGAGNVGGTVIINGGGTAQPQPDYVLQKRQKLSTRLRATMLKNSRNSLILLLKLMSRACALLAIAKKWRISTVLLLVSVRYMRCSSRVQVSRLALSTR